MADIKHSIFQVDSEEINNCLASTNNYLIEYSNITDQSFCAVYFSSNDLYFPNSAIAFNETIVKKNRFEWYGNRIEQVYKHIFIRDIQKQWYLNGINSHINSPKKLLKFLKTETQGYKTIYLGSSAGGFAAVQYGQQLNAEKIFSFNGQFELNSLLTRSSEPKEPLIFRNKNNQELLPYFDARNFITDPKKIFYFQSNKSDWDIEQAQAINEIELNHIVFNSSNHGLPFYRFNLESILNSNEETLLNLKNKTHNPFNYSTHKIGLLKTTVNLINLYNNYFFKLLQRKVLSKFIFQK